MSITAFPKPPTREGDPKIPNDGTLPGISKELAGQGATGFGGVPVKGQLFPPMRSETTPVGRELQPSQGRADSVRPKKGLFGRGPPGATGGAKLAISGPILQGSTSEQNPFAKIATVDLATAAKNERERREQVDGPRKSTTLIATRPAPQPPAVSPEEALRRAQSTKRKEIASAAPSEAGVESQAMSGQTLAEPVAMTSSAQLSPGVEELRKRSPRLGPQNTPKVPELPRELENPRAAPVPEQQGPPRRPPRPETLDIDVKPRTLQDTGFPKFAQINMMPSNSGSPATGKPQLSAAGTPRIPSPLPMPFQSPLEESPPSRGYPAPQAASSPQAVRQSPPPPAPPSPPEDPKEELDPRKSVLPRNSSVKANIRPSRRRPPSLEDVPPSPEKPAVQRRAAAGLPGNPRAMAMRQMEKETKSQRQQTVMFVNNIEYNDPVGVKNILQGAAKQAAMNSQPQPEEGTRGSVLNRPRPIPRNNRDEGDAVQEEVETPSTRGHQRNMSNGSATSKRSILKANPGSPTRLPPLPPLPTHQHPGNQIRPQPNDTKSMTFDEKMDMFFPIPPSASADGNSRSHFSPVPAVPSFPPSFLETDDESVRNTRTTKSSLQTQSVVEIAEVGRRPPMDMRNTAKFSSDTETTAAASQTWIPPVPRIQPLGYPAYEGEKRQSSPILPYPVDGMPMFTADDARQQAAKRETYASENGEKEVMTIMFDRSEAQRREVAERESWMAEGEPAMGPSTKVSDGAKRESQFHQRIGEACPTFSNRREKTRSRKMVPPTPLLLHGAASKNAVVLRAAEPSPLESPTGAYREIQAKLERLDRPDRDSTGSEARKQDLLANLEREMGMQEDHWREMHDGLRDSLSTIRTSPTRNSVYEARMSRQAQVKRGSLLKPSAVAQAQLRSPTPPDTDESEDDAIVARVAAGQKPKANPPEKATLWQPSVTAPAHTTSVSLLWTPPPKPLPQAGGTISPVSLDMRTPRKAKRVPVQQLDKLQNPTLWQKSPKPSPPTGHLWGTTAPISQRTPRPPTQRPSRKSRRMTLLPDILESPQPLPDKRGTLGIFQFPWGERSDTASAGARPSMLRAMPGTMTSGGPSVSAALEARSRAVETEEYSSSFFDEYDEAEESDEVDSDEEGGEFDEGDEDFDETTLWEIASLLKTDRVPSKMSLLPSPEGPKRGEASVTDEYMRDEDERKDSIIVALDPSVVPQKASLWAKPARPRESALGLPQPSAREWMRYLALGAPARREPRRVDSVRLSWEDPAPAVSGSLWESREPERRYPSLLWGPVMPREAGMSKGPVHLPRQRRSVASREDWDAALREAVAASYPKNKPSPAMEEEWDAALNEALALSKPTTPHHTGLWSKPQQPTTRPSPLWQPGQPRHEPDWTAPEPAAPTRRAAPEEGPLPVFLWQNMWRIQDVQRGEGKNWLEDVVNKRFKGIQFRY